MAGNLLKLECSNIIANENLEAHTNYFNNNIKSKVITATDVFNAQVSAFSVNKSISGSMTYFENALHVSPEILAGVNNYKFVFGETIKDIIEKAPESSELSNAAAASTEKEDKTKDVDMTGTKVIGQMTHRIAVPSLFNPYLSMNVIGSVKGIPIFNKLTNDTVTANVTSVEKDGDKKEKTSTDEFTVNLNTINDADITDCRIETLVRLSNMAHEKRDGTDNAGYYSPLGMERYKYADFMFCKDVGKISNNYLITLRRFAHPVGDNIVSGACWRKVGPDIGRMVCWLGEENKLEDILKYNYQMTWRELNAKIDQKNSDEDASDRGIIGSIVNLANPSYLKQVAAGKAGGGNIFLGNFKVTSSIIGKVVDNKGTYEGHQCLGNYDKNRVYEPKDTVQDTMQYEGKLKFSQEFTLTFNYELRAYDNINPRTAFNDLLSNIEHVTYRRGRFWGGANQILGAPANPGGWKKANLFIDEAWDKLGGFVEGLFAGNLDWSSVWGSISNVLGQAGEQVANVISQAGGDPSDHSTGGIKNNVQKVALAGIKKFKSSGLSDAFKGMLKNGIGRPAMYAFDSLLKGDPVGQWHVTIGNPRQPILSMGNIIITGTDVQHYGPLGIDDFPTGLKVQIKCKHGRSRDLMGIQHMYTGGSDGLALATLGVDQIERYFKTAPGTQKQEIQTANTETQFTNYTMSYPEAYKQAGIQEIFGTSNWNAITSGFAAHNPSK